MHRLVWITMLGSLLCGDFFCPRSVKAESWAMGTLPSKRSKLGYAMSIHLEAVGGNGYQPVHLKFRPSGKSFLRDRHVEVSINPVYDSSSTFKYSYQQSMTLPEGSTSFSKTIHVPYYYDWKRINVELKEDGREIEWGSRSIVNSGNLRFGCANQVVTVGIIQPRDAAARDAPWKTFPDVRTLVTVLGDGPIPAESSSGSESVGVPERMGHRQSLALAKQVQPAWVQFRPIEESGLPETWLGYSQLDVILAPAPLVDRIADEQPERIETLKAWIAAGGNLWMHAAEQGSGKFANSITLQAILTERLISPKSVRKLLNLNVKNDTSPLIFDGWNGVTKESLHYSYQNDGAEMSTRDTAFAKLTAAKHPFAKRVETASLAKGLSSASIGLGQIIAIEAEDPFPGSYQLWKSLAEFAGPTRLHWPERNGVDVPKGNDGYWSWLIGSVGQPPVKSFVFMNLLFAIFIGPVCYRFLRRRGRLYLLYFVAPCVALLVTCGLFAYAILVDGVRTKQRTRQITWIDSINDYNVGQDRTTCYRVFGYGQQVDVSIGTAIYPVRHTPVLMGYYARNSNEGHLHGVYASTDSRQRLGSGFLPSRNQVQFVTTDPVRTERSIDVDFKSKVVSSQFNQVIRQLIVCDQDGDLWTASGLAPSSSEKLLRSKADIKVLIGMIMDSNVLADETNIPTLLTYRWAQNSTVSHQSMLEVRMKKWLKRLPANSFIGVADIDQDRLGLADAKMIDNIHIIMGTLP